MNEQHEALRLAELLEQIDGQHWQVQDCAAAELRKQHEVIQRLLRERNISLESAQRDTARITELEKQRDELLAALKKLEYSSDGYIKRYPEEAEVNAVIVRAEEQK